LQAEIPVLGIAEQWVFADVAPDAILICDAPYPVTARVPVDITAGEGGGGSLLDEYGDTLSAEGDNRVLQHCRALFPAVHARTPNSCVAIEGAVLKCEKARTPAHGSTPPLG